MKHLAKYTIVFFLVGTGFCLPWFFSLDKFIILNKYLLMIFAFLASQIEVFFIKKTIPLLAGVIYSDDGEIFSPGLPGRSFDVGFLSIGGFVWIYIAQFS